MISTIQEPATDEGTASFAEMRLSATTLAALGRMGIETPTPIQAATLPALLDGRDVIGQARTGSGKTLAFGIPAVEIVNPGLRAVQVLVLTPTRELAIQVGGVLSDLGAAKGVTVGLIFGGRAFGPQRELLRRGVHVVVGTPGRVLDLLGQGVLWLDKVRFLVLDEADEMLDRGFAPDVERIIARATPDRQTALFSATVPDWVRHTADRHLVRPVSVAVDPHPEDAAPIEHVAYDVPNGDKLAALRDLLDHRGDGSIIVFGRTKHGVKKLARQLAGAGYPVAALQGNLSQNARDQVMEDFRAGVVPILLATNVAARGLDVTHVAQVINVELPESPELLTHRIGRTGRMGRRGQAITLLAPDDAPKWRRLERGLGRRIPRVAWRGGAAALAAAVEEAPTPQIAPPPRRVSASRGGALAPSATVRPAPDEVSKRRTARRSRRSPRGEGGGPDAPGRRPATNRPVGGLLEDPRADTEVADPLALLAAYGRDPHRPAWTRDDGRDAGQVEVANRPAGRNGRGRRHRITCAACGQEAAVSFRPDPTRPVYCADCFRARGRKPRHPEEAAVQAS